MNATNNTALLVALENLHAATNQLSRHFGQRGHTSLLSADEFAALDRVANFAHDLKWDIAKIDAKIAND